MTLLQLLGFFCALLIGLSLGLMGGGGSILTMPVLVYLLGVNPIVSTAYSLFVVGVTSLVGSVGYIQKQQVNYQAVVLFSVPSFGAVFMTRRYLIPAIPDPVYIHESVRLSKAPAFMLLVALLMLAASISLIAGSNARSQSPHKHTVSFRYNAPLLVLTGVIVGILTGLAGIGGGFLIVPALVLLVRLPMKQAVGTSLLIIAANSLIGLLSNTVSEQISWPFLLEFTSMAMLGILVGTYVSRYVSGPKLRSAFGWSLLGISIVIIAKETLMPVISRSPLVEPQPRTPLWKAPDLSEANQQPDSNSIRYGRKLIARTAYYLGPGGKVARLSNGMNCQNCHLEAGTKPWGNNFGAVAATYPKFRERSGMKETIVKRISDCFERSLNGHPPDSASREMRAIVVYIRFIGRAVPKGEIPAGTGLWPLPYLDRAANATNGRGIYRRNCVACHGANGQGKPRPDGSGYVYPPLWGRHSYNTGAGLFRISRLAGYIKANMPLGTSWDAPRLSDEEAWDLAAYINSRPRPVTIFPADWPNLKGKPVDHPFGPFADSFSAQQHKFGPFKAIDQFRKTTERAPSSDQIR